MSADPHDPEAPPADPVFALAWSAFTRSHARQTPGRSLMALAAFFGLMHLGEGDAFSLLAVVAIVVLHELGHRAAMNALSYEEERIFALPWFARTAARQAMRRSAIRRSLVLLAGPLPGLLLGLALAGVAAWLGSPPRVIAFADLLVFINGVMLLPLDGSDGERLTRSLVISRDPRLEAPLAAVSGLVVGGVGLVVGPWWLAGLGLWLFGGVLRLPPDAAARARRLRMATAELSADPETLSIAARVGLFEAARDVAARRADLERESVDRQGALVGEWMERLYARLAPEPLGHPAAGVLLVAYAAAVAAFVIALAGRV